MAVPNNKKIKGIFGKRERMDTCKIKEEFRQDNVTSAHKVKALPLPNGEEREREREKEVK